MDKKETLKNMLTSLAGFTEKITKIKESLASLASDETQGGKVDTLTDEQKAEAAKIEEAKAAELATAEAAKKKAEDEKAEEKAGKDNDAEEKDEEKKKAKAALEIEEAKAAETAKAELIKKEIEEAAAAKAKSDADEEAKKLQAKAALELAEAEAAKKAKEAKFVPFKKAMSSEDVVELGLEAGEAELASKYSFVELVKVLASMSKEVASLKEEKTKAEASKTADSRYKELVDLGVAFIGKKAEAQKLSLSSMDEKAFASYKELALSMKEASDSGEGLTAEAVAKAKASIGGLSIEVKLGTETLADKYKKLK